MGEFNVVKITNKNLNQRRKTLQNEEEQQQGENIQNAETENALPLNEQHFETRMLQKKTKNTRTLLRKFQRAEQTY